MGMHLCVVWTEDTRDTWRGACQSTIPKTDEEACSSFSNPLSANHSTQWRLVSLRCPHQFTVCWKVDFLLLYAKQCFFFEATQFSEKEIFCHKFSKLGQKTGFLGRVNFLKREYSVTNISNSPNYGKKLGF
jgi:hypothetical protein